MPKTSAYPLVSVICLCYNHERFVKEALQSVLFQSYPHFEMIIVDDASEDGSVAKIQAFIQEIDQYREAYAKNTYHKIPQHFRVEFIQNEQNLGNCAAFNRAFTLSKGKYIIDFATDDVMLDDRLAQQVQTFGRIGTAYGVMFSNAIEIDEAGKMLRYHYPIDSRRMSKVDVPSGDIYQAILKKYFICSPTMMMRREVLEDLQGYDESLSYEDFDFWVRSARKYPYYYQDTITTLRRIVKKSHATHFYTKGQNAHLRSTLEVCRKAAQLNQTEADDQALAICIKYHLRQAFFAQDFDLVFQFEDLLEQVRPSAKDGITNLILWLAQKKIKLHGWYQFYRKVAHSK